MAQDSEPALEHAYATPRLGGVAEVVRVRTVLSHPLPTGLADGLEVRVLSISTGVRIVPSTLT